MSQQGTGEPPERPKLLNVTLIVVVGLIGIVTLAIVLGAVFLGLWLDSRYGTRPWWTIGLVLGSIPVSLLVMLFIVRKATTKIKSVNPGTLKPEEEKDLGKNS
jgi:MFS family permease